VEGEVVASMSLDSGAGRKRACTEEGWANVAMRKPWRGREVTRGSGPGIASATTDLGGDQILGGEQSTSPRAVQLKTPRRTEVGDDDRSAGGKHPGGHTNLKAVTGVKPGREGNGVRR
jgi:hypothetical protein